MEEGTRERQIERRIVNQRDLSRGRTVVKVDGEKIR
jgi:hypothetical protein